jgi:hypothetical protein
LLTALRRNGKSLLLEQLGEIGADEEVLERLLTRLKRAAAQDLGLGYAYAFLLSWLVARVGPELDISYEVVEAEVGNAAESSSALVMPRWTLAMPIAGALQRRMPCKPLVEGEDEEHRAMYRRASRLFDEMRLARADGTYSRLLARVAKMDVLVLDDFAIAPLTDGERRDLLEILEDRHGTRSTIITSQLPPKEWHDYLADPTLADAICDRLVHQAHRIVLKGPSRRKEPNTKE